MGRYLSKNELKVMSNASVRKLLHDEKTALAFTELTRNKNERQKQRRVFRKRIAQYIAELESRGCKVEKTQMRVQKE